MLRNTPKSRIVWNFSAIFCLCLLPHPQPHAQLFHRPSKEFRTLNTASYAFSIQKNGRTDVLLPNGAPLFENAHPMVRLLGEADAVQLPVDGQRTTTEATKDPLGDGNTVHIGGDGCVWMLKSYPSQPFFTVQLVYINNTKKNVQVAGLLPWCAGGEKEGGYRAGEGAEGARILTNGNIVRAFSDMPEVKQGNASSGWNLAVYNPSSSRSLVLGFLSHLKASTELRIGRNAEAAPDQFNTLQTECFYDPPVTVAPGASLASEILYVGITEDSPHTGLRRYGSAVAAINNVTPWTSFLPHGWDSWSTRYHRDISEASMLAELDALHEKLARYGWNHFAMDAGWELGKGHWQPDPAKFPNGLRPIVDAAHARRMTAGLWIDPFTVSLDSPLAKEHPDWLVSPSLRGRMVIGNDERILDPTVPEAYEWVRSLAHTITHEWGFDALMEADFVYHLLLGEGYRDSSMTNIEVLRRGMQALRDGIGPTKFMMSMTPHPVTGTYANGVRVGLDNKPLWSSGTAMGNWGAKESLTNAIRRFYYSPLYIPDQDCAFFGHEASYKRWNVSDKKLTRDQSIAWLTGAALTGGVIKIGEAYSDLAQDEVDILRRLLPAPPKPAIPLDLFDPETPRVWHLSLENDKLGKDDGRWDILALFGWDTEGSTNLKVPLDVLDLDASAFYAVYDFWPQQYLGTITGVIEAAVPPDSVRLLGLRRFTGRPMLIASDAHYTQGALDQQAMQWDAASKTLSGTFDAVERTNYKLTFSIPEGFTAFEFTCSTGDAVLTPAQHFATATFTASTSGPCTWTLRAK